MKPDTSRWSVDEWLSYLEAIHPAEIDMGLERVTTVGKSLACLKPAPVVILVGGTNGKGTTSALIAALLRRQGLRVGVYNSPHIYRYNERVTIDEREISDAELCVSFAAVEAARGDTSLTYFEFGTLAALWHFAQSGLDAVVLEIGLGGRLDAVNIVDADISVVTSIGLDHQAWLGNTTADIAYEKCSIARPGRWLVCGQEAPPAMAKETVDTIGGRWCGRNEDFFAALTDGQLQVDYDDEGESRRLIFPAFSIPHHNVATAIQALSRLRLLPDDDEIVDVVAGLKVAGRWQSHTVGNRTLVLDVAHNPQAAAYLRSHVDRVDCLVLGMLSDKDVAGVLEALPAADRLYTVTLGGWRGLTAKQLAERAESAGFAVDASFDSMAEALAMIPASGTTLVAGSFHTVEAAGEIIRSGEGEWNSI